MSASSLRLLRQLVDLAGTPDLTLDVLRSAIAETEPALRFLESHQPTLRETVRDLSEDPECVDHGAAKRLLTCANACLGIPTPALSAGVLTEHIELSEQLAQYAQAIRDCDLDGSEPELAELLQQYSGVSEQLVRPPPATPEAALSGQEPTQSTQD